MKKKVAVLGATGSVGKNTLDVLREGKDFFTPVLFSGHTRANELVDMGREFPGVSLALSGRSSGPEDIRYFGKEGLLRAIAESGADIVVNGITGAAGLEPSLAVLETGADLALANKETIVMASSLVFAKSKEKNARILPVDSEHSAIFNLSETHGKENIAEILLTASGGPFRNYSVKELSSVTPEQALAHPTWNMGPKITVDCATLGNKGLEVIESVGLFGLTSGEVRIVIHPQSVVHSMIRLKDGVVYAQLSRPDMRLPIHETLYWPEFHSCPFGRLNFDNLTLSFTKPDFEKFPMLPLAYMAAKTGGLYPAAYNAANEKAVESFLQGQIGFLDIPRTVDYVLQDNWETPLEDLATVLAGDARARKRAEAFISGLQ